MKPITIIGGGLAGLTLGIFLRRENIPVTVIEAGRYPRHRVCGEFLSGRGREILRSLNPEQKLPHSVEARTCSFHMQNRRPIRLDLTKPALCISRFDLDACLANEFRNLGGILNTGERANAETNEAGVIRATGRRRSENRTAHLFGLKAHAFSVACSTDLEMHFGDRKYVGLCRLPEGRINVCGLFYSEQPVRTIHEGWKQILDSSVWSESLQSATWDENSFSSVAGLTMDRNAPEDHFSIGDASAMIPPLTGNGMSMALESAHAAFPFVWKYCRGETSWADCVRAHAADWRVIFSSRLRWAAFVQRLIFHSPGQRVLLLGARLIPSLPNLFFSRTR
jgi:flavin-dependent dehydrogenase